MDRRGFLGHVFGTLAAAGLVKTLPDAAPVAKAPTLSIAARNAVLDGVDVFAAPVLRIYSGAPPRSADDPASGTLLCEMSLPMDYAAGGHIRCKPASGQVLTTDTAGYFRLDNPDTGATVMQGTVGDPYSAGDMMFDNRYFSSGQTLAISTFSVGVHNTIPENLRDDMLDVVRTQMGGRA